MVGGKDTSIPVRGPVDGGRGLWDAVDGGCGPGGPVDGGRGLWAPVDGGRGLEGG